eukprot:GILJ01002882.1.p1 GENE.GILJ01002882.1~~GILJ01002882.1.p1  ORF type:complete len:231 (+),score=12.41 GILJ01002882.1:75-767(+)
MLLANKAATVSELTVTFLEVRAKELDYYTSNYNAISTMASLIAGFAFAALTIPIPETDDPHVFLKLTCLVSTACAMGFELVAVTIATFCTMFGPGLALRGSHGPDSIHKAVEELKDHMNVTMTFFLLGILAMFSGIVCLSWLTQSIACGLIVTFVMATFVFILIRFGSKIFYALRVDNAVSGKFNTDFWIKQPCVQCINQVMAHTQPMAVFPTYHIKYQKIMALSCASLQ